MPRQSGARPEEFIGDPPRQTVAAEVHGHGGPRVGLDLEVPDSVAGKDGGEALIDFALSGPEMAEFGEVDRHMEVRAPDSIGGLIERVAEVLVRVHDTVTIEDTSLVKELRFIEVAQRTKGARGSITDERARYLDLADADSSGAIARERLSLRLEHHSAVADVMADAKVTARVVEARRRLHASLEELDDMGGAIEHASGLGFDVKVNGDAIEFFDALKVASNLRQVRACETEACAAALGSECWAPAKWQRRDRSLGGEVGGDRRVGKNCGKNVRERGRVQHAPYVGPGGLVHSMFSLAGVEVAIGESIHREDDESALEEPVAQAFGSIGIVDYFLGSARREPKPDGHESRRLHECAHGGRVLVERIERCLQRRARVHIGAVTENRRHRTLGAAAGLVEGALARAASMKREKIASPIVVSVVRSGCHCTPT